MGSPRLTVFTPNFNHGAYISRTIESVVSQSRPPDQFVIVDDGSTDNSLEVIRPHLRRFPYLELVAAEHRGLWATLELALSKAAGDYVFCLPADDYILPGFFEKAMAAAERHPEAGIIFGLIQASDAEGNIFWKQTLPGSLAGREETLLGPERFLEDYLKAEVPINSPSPATIYRRTALMEVGYVHPDLDAWGDTFAIWAIGLKYGACALNHIATTFRQGTTTSLSGSWFNNPLKALGGITRAAQRMLSPEFRDRFPVEFVRTWHRGYLETLLRGQPEQGLKQFDDLVESLPLPPEMNAKLTIRLQRRLLSWLMARHARARLRLARQFYCGWLNEKSG
jgi:glycosyltransferase involved in cell wall biosynthesis